jgi:hypothetical protein
MDRQRQKTEAELRKEETDKHRERRGAFQRKRLHALRNPEKLAFTGWKDVLEPWTLANYCEYIEWYYIGKVFPEDRHNKHRRFSKANLKYCLDAEFKQWCIEVYQGEQSRSGYCAGLSQASKQDIGELCRTRLPHSFGIYDPHDLVQIPFSQTS